MLVCFQKCNVVVFFVGCDMGVHHILVWAEWLVDVVLNQLNHNNEQQKWSGMQSWNLP